MTEQSKDAYQEIAGNYARKLKTAPMNLYYERPGTLSLLPPLAHTNVLDAGCGPGWYAEYLLDHGASVTAFDVNAEFVALTQERVGDRATVLQADLAQPLDFAAGAAFDLVVCPLVMHYLEDWEQALREFYRILKADGRLVFSTHHPFWDWQLFERENYFAVELLEDEWDDVGKVTFYRRPLTTISRDLEAAGFVIERLLEPYPSAEMQSVRPELYDKLHKEPAFLFVRARKA